ncbi:histidine phosphatase family protein [Actinoplanes sp. CA-142083]|uniref:histidine phosphatase family protein n=1 Tax=Actinoplanes sp. CA-142083 TaxID=3239903 RepID=UPI003D8C8D48
MTFGVGARLLLVRHAMPETDPDTPPEQWHLGPEGRAAARALARLIAEPRAGHYVASTEPKAVETLREIAPHAPIATDAGFAEVRRPRAWTDDVTYRAAARAYIEGDTASRDGWEARDEVVGRFDAAVARHAGRAAASGVTLVVGTHGLAPTLWLAARVGLRPSPGAFWASLRFPDVVEVDPRRKSVRRLPA